MYIAPRARHVVQPFLRRIITRLIGLIPSVVVAIAVGKRGIDTLLVASQVALAIVLPFVAAPLILLTSSKAVMSVRRPLPDVRTPAADELSLGTTGTQTQPELLLSDGSSDRIEEIPHAPEEDALPCSLDDEKAGAVAVTEKEVGAQRTQDVAEDASVSALDEDGYISFANHWAVTAISTVIFLIILAANVYAIVMLALGKAG